MNAYAGSTARLRGRIKRLARDRLMNFMCGRSLPPKAKVEPLYEWHAAPHQSLFIDSRWPDRGRDGQNGFVVADQTARALARGIETIMEMRPDAYRDLRDRCRTVAEAEYGLETMARVYLACYGLHPTPADARNLHDFQTK